MLDTDVDTCMISIRAPLAGSDNERERFSASAADFNPRSPCGERLSKKLRTAGACGFQSALPLRGATAKRPHSLRPCRPFQSALPLRGATLIPPGTACRLQFQSALPLRGATNPAFTTIDTTIFQSALPLRGATATFCSINLLSAKCCIFKDRRRKFSRQTPQNNSKKRHNEVRSSLVEHERL